MHIPTTVARRKTIQNGIQLDRSFRE